MARRTAPPDDTDVVVIGGGFGGLIAGAILARAGLDVTVVEAEHRPGGYLAGFRRKGFTFDSAIHWLNQCAPGGIIHRVLSFIGPGHPDCAPLHEIRRYKGDDFDFLLTDDPDELKRRFIEQFPHERAGIERLFRDSRVLGERMVHNADLMRTVASMNLLEKAWFGLKLFHWALPFANKYRAGTVEGLARYVSDPEFQRLFASEQDLVSVMVPIGWAYHHDFQAPPAGGSQVFCEWLVDQIDGAPSASQVVLSRRVAEVLVDEDDAVRGVRLAAAPRVNQPEHTVSCRWVIATGDLVTLYEHMLPERLVDRERLRRLQDMELYHSSVTISLGLDCRPEQLGFGKEMWHITADDVPRDEQASGDPERSALFILAPSERDPTLAPPGKGTLVLFVQARIEYAGCWKTAGPDGDYARGPEYRAFKEEYARKVIARVERLTGADISGHIEVLDVATPVTHWRYTGNRGGTIMGGRPSRPNLKNRVASHYTPVTRLLVGGQWAMLGGGLPIVARAAANAALLVLKQTRPADYRLLRDVMMGRLAPEEASPRVGSGGPGDAEAR